MAAFTRAGDYYDAPRHLSNAQAQVRQRDTGYRQGVAALARQDWIGAYRAFSETLTIQPTYSDTRQLYSLAREQALAATLAGTVYRQATGGQPGLYLTRPAGGPAIYLPGSDGQSRIIGSNPALDRLAYDGPPGSGPPGAAPAPRQIWLAGPDNPQPVALPAAFGEAGTVVPARQGAWRLRFGEAPLAWSNYGGLPLGAQLWAASWIRELDYYDAGHNSMNARPLGDAVVWFGSVPPNGLLLGVYGHDEAGGRQTQLVLLLTPDQPAPQVLTTVSGVVYWAAISPDGSTLAYTVGTGATGPLDSLVLAWRDLRTPTLPQPPLTTVLLSGFQPLAGLIADWVPDPAPRACWCARSRDRPSH